MNAKKNELPLHVVVNRYIIFVNELLDAGWHVYGESKPIFMANPHDYHYGAVKFFKKNGVTHSVSVGLHVNATEDGAAFVYGREYNLSGVNTEWDTFEKVLDIDINGLDYDSHSKLLIEKYKETLIIDFHDKDNKFLGFKSGNRAIFLTPQDNLITKSVSLSDYTALNLTEATSQLKLNQNYAAFNEDDFFDLIF